jgi:hypothetical protein
MSESRRLVPMALCPECRREFWLLDARIYELGSGPDEFVGDEPVTFVCCGKPQSVPPQSIVYRPQRVAVSGSRRFQLSKELDDPDNEAQATIP